MQKLLNNYYNIFSHLYIFIRNLAETTDPNIIIIDPSKLLGTEIDNIYLEFKRFLDDLHKKMKDAQKIDLKEINGNCA